MTDDTKRGQWGIVTKGGWYDWEENMLRGARPPSPQPSDNSQKREVLLVDKSGSPLIVREPRPVGFRR